METIVGLIVLCLVFGAIYYCVTLLPVPDPFKRIAIILVILLFVLILLRYYVPLGILGLHH